MDNKKLQVSEISKPRFEFGSFGQDFNNQVEQMARLSVPDPKKFWVRHSLATYIMSKDGVENINYLQARRRVIGWIDKHLGN